MPEQMSSYRCGQTLGVPPRTEMTQTATAAFTLWIQAATEETGVLIHSSDREPLPV